VTQWYEAHYAQALGRKKGQTAGEDDVLSKQRSNHVQRKVKERASAAKVDAHLEQQFTAGRLYACISSRPGQCGRADGYILEGKELEFYLRKLRSHKH
jgi:small subunit ribosomal protein S8e